MSYNEKKGSKVEFLADGIYFSVKGSYQNKFVVVGIHFDMKYKTTKLRKEAFEEGWKKHFNVEYSAEHMETVGVAVIDFANILGRKGFELVGIENYNDKDGKETNEGETWTFKRKLN